MENKFIIIDRNNRVFSVDLPIVFAYYSSVYRIVHFLVSVATRRDFELDCGLRWSCGWSWSWALDLSWWLEWELVLILENVPSWPWLDGCLRLRAPSAARLAIDLTYKADIHTTPWPKCRIISAATATICAAHGAYSKQLQKQQKPN